MEVYRVKYDYIEDVVISVCLEELSSDAIIYGNYEISVDTYQEVVTFNIKNLNKFMLGGQPNRKYCDVIFSGIRNYKLGKLLNEG